METLPSPGRFTMDIPRCRVSISFQGMVLGLLLCLGGKWPGPCQHAVHQEHGVNWIDVNIRPGMPGSTKSSSGRNAVEWTRLGPFMHVKDA